MVESKEWITQSEAARIKGMSLKAINALSLRGRIASREVYGKILVSRSDVLAYEPKTRNKWSKVKQSSKGKKSKAKK